MAAVFPLDTTKPWVFNGVTYEYDTTDDRWFVVSTTATDQVVGSINALEQTIDVTNTVIDQEIENRTNLLNVAASKNNTQDAAIDELSGRVDAVASSVGILEFKGRYAYRLERSDAACDAAYIACLAQANNDPLAMSECSRLYDECKLDIGNALPDGTFTSVGTIEQSNTEELVIALKDADGNTYDWENLLETGDYLEIVEETLNDAILYQVIADPVRSGTEERIRVKYIKETGDGDGKFNLQEVCEIRVIKQSLGLDIAKADKRYVQRPYQVISRSNAPTEGQAEDKVLRNGELWYDTLNLELFVWNNNAWVTAAKPASEVPTHNHYAPANLRWKFSSNTAATAPPDGYFKRDINKRWRFSFKTWDGVNLGIALIDDTDTHSWETQMSVWYKDGTDKWQLKAHYLLNEWRWNYNSGGKHAEFKQQSVLGQVLSNNAIYNVTIGSWW